MIPLVVVREELALARSLGRGGAGRGRRRRRATVHVGTMVETPRAALRAHEIAEVADFFSFGTNDLTQLTFGFSRDDVEGRMMTAYLEQGLLPRDPFSTVDQGGVADLMRLGIERRPAHPPRLKVGVCGEHGGDPASIAAFLGAGRRLRLLLALPGADRPAGRGPGRARPGRPPRATEPRHATGRAAAGSVRAMEVE